MVVLKADGWPLDYSKRRERWEADDCCNRWGDFVSTWEEEVFNYATMQWGKKKYAAFECSFCGNWYLIHE